MNIIAYYLPQFHPIPQNNVWWGDGFTDWVSVRNAKPLFSGHNQPHVPHTDLGYYNLLNTDVIIRQTAIAQQYLVDAFAFWHYWFNGTQLLEQPLLNALESSEFNFPICLAWANESWKAKEWSNRSGKRDKVLISQTYSHDDDIRHFYSILPILRDRRYLRIDNKPVFIIYRPLNMPNTQRFIQLFNSLAKENTLDGIYFIGHTLYSSQASQILQLGFDAVNIVPLGDIRRSVSLWLRNIPQLIKYALRTEPLYFPYEQTISVFSKSIYRQNNVFPTIMPNWDHSPRSGIDGFILHESTPKLFGKQVSQVLQVVGQKPAEQQVVFLKSWNEWGEGNYIEPDTEFEYQYLNQIKLCRTNIH